MTGRTTGRLYGVGVGPGDPELISSHLTSDRSACRSPTSFHVTSSARSSTSSSRLAGQPTTHCFTFGLQTLALSDFRSRRYATSSFAPLSR